ncbi:MAG: phosphomannomutase/phosphoglucomutase [Holosporales bacterium]|nr:phosphomannomutase/phosphoglucomutase [Holosporales bacterium]
MSVEPYWFNPSLLRAYDIRGIVGETLSETDAYYVGRAFATLLPERSGPLAVGRDGRLSSPSLEEALIRGLQESGQDVCSIGCVSTPLLYYTVFEHAPAGGVMITGSHNPPQHNGVKLLQGHHSLFGDQIQQIGTIAASGRFRSGKGRRYSFVPQERYILRLLQGITISSRFRVAWDTGNGVVGPLLQDLISHLNCTSFIIHAEVDGHFPNHPPDPAVPEHLQVLQDLVHRESCTLGIAFDGDGDRIAVVDEQGQRVPTDALLVLFAQDILMTSPGAPMIADVKTSQVFFSEVARLGGQPVMERTGHSFVKSRMHETRAPFAGELSGHFFFADRWYGFDDGLYTALRLLELLSKQEKPLSALVQSTPTRFTTPELSFPCPDIHKKQAMARVAQRLQQDNISFSTIDGVRVTTPQGWWLLRASNTQALLTGRVEATSLESQEILLQDLKHYLQEGQKLDAP